MIKMGRIFRQTFGNSRPPTSLEGRYRKGTAKEIKEANNDETLEQATRRQAKSYFGRDFNSLNPSEKAYARQRAKDFRKNVYVQRD